MLDTAIRVAKHRKMAYQDLMSKANTDLLPVSHEIPQIEIVIDEGAEILASTDKQHRVLARKILEVIRIARAMALRTVLTALGATGAVLGDLMIRREAKVRAALTGGETEGMDLSKLFPGSRGLKVDQAPYKGAGFLGTPESGIGLFKSWRIKPAQIRDIVIATSDRHPRLDPVSAKAAGPDYARRWDQNRTAWITEHHTTPPVESQTSAGGSGLNLSALRSDPTPAAPAPDAVDAEFERLIGIEFTTSPQPQTPDTPEEPKAEPSGLNLSALRDDKEAGPSWLPDAITAIRAAGRRGHEARRRRRPRRPQPRSRPQDPQGRRRTRRTPLPRPGPALRLRPPRSRLNGHTPLPPTAYRQIGSNPRYGPPTAHQAPSPAVLAVGSTGLAVGSRQ